MASCYLEMMYLEVMMIMQSVSWFKDAGDDDDVFFDSSSIKKSW